ncbi:hypothetical protein L3i22_088840 [Actinoplanes sp. L3-i22]|nr:hypothetical protein L3i22_088840 [Actinoplanes sp. L3-i22]
MTLVLVDPAGELLGALPPFPVETPWWQEVAEIVARAGVEVTVLRLLHADRVAPPGGHVTYLAETRERPDGLIPLGADLVPHALRAPWAEPGGPAATLAWAAGALDRLGIDRVTPRQQRTWNLSAIWRMDGPDGPVAWLKQVPGFFAHEPVVISRVAAIAPTLVPYVLAAGAAGRMLLAHVPGDDRYGAGPELCAAVAEAFHPVQAHFAGRFTGRPDAAVPGRFDFDFDRALAEPDGFERTARPGEPGGLEAAARPGDPGAGRGGDSAAGRGGELGAWRGGELAAGRGGEPGAGLGGGPGAGRGGGPGAGRAGAGGPGGVPDKRLDAGRLAAVAAPYRDDIPGLAELIDGLPARLAEVAACGLPDTLLHGDLHPGNVRTDGAGAPVIIDWGDSAIGHPAFDLLRLIEGLESPEPLVAAWSRRWRETVPGCAPERAVELLRPVAPLVSAATYAGFLAHIEQSEWPYHAGDVPDCLTTAAATAAEVRTVAAWRTLGGTTST